MIKELNHIEVMPPDLEASLELYRDALGGRVIRDESIMDGRVRFVYVQFPGGVVEFVNGRPASSDLGLHHIGFFIDDDENLDAVYSRLSEMGFRFTMMPKSASSGNGRVAFFEDISGASFELLERKEDIKVRDWPSDQAIAIGHVAICVKSEDTYSRCLKFYTETLGFEVVESNVDKTAFLSLGEATLKLSLDPAEGKPIGHIMFWVSDINWIRRSLESRYEVISGAGRELSILGPAGETLIFAER
jgi:catechol 2,3-dioxygenase-like lactoylglutathione lyase family enzyme